jgi:hypothetical protein
MKNKFINFNCRIPTAVKDLLKNQSTQEGVPMGTIAQELLMVGLIMRIKDKDKLFMEFEKIQNKEKQSIGFMEY